MKVQCSYCNSWMNDTEEKCSNCGGINIAYKRSTDKTPKTIDELKQWYADHHLPPAEKTRFYIGLDYQGPRAFGVYRNAKGEFVVYKNKDNGQRAIRYQGTDEAYAVNELYLKLKEEILNQKRHNSLRSKSGNTTGNKRRKKKSGSPDFSVVFCAVLVIITIVTSIGKFSIFANRHEGYYRVNDRMLYRYYNTWYEYQDDYGDDDTYSDYSYSDSDDYDADGTQNGRWVEAEEDYDNYQDIWDYNLGTNYAGTTDWNSNIQKFTDSYAYEQAYEEHISSSSDSDSDSGYDWDSGDSWDSGDTDWGSD